MKVSAKTKKKPNPITVDYDIPEKLPELVKKYGEEVVSAHAVGSIVISLQALMRRHIEKDDFSLPKLQEAVKAWKPDVRNVVKQSAFEKVSSSLDKLSPEERSELLKKLTAKPSGAGATAKV